METIPENMGRLKMAHRVLDQARKKEDSLRQELHAAERHRHLAEKTYMSYLLGALSEQESNSERKRG